MRTIRLRLLDYLALAVSLTLVAGASWAAASQGEPELVAIQSNEGEFLYPLDADRELVLSGPLGTTRIEIAGRRVRVAEDPGPQQICVRQGWIASSGEWLACLPSRIFIEITGARDDAVDGQTY
jgi:hypothetical protein